MFTGKAYHLKQCYGTKLSTVRHDSMVAIIIQKYILSHRIPKCAMMIVDKLRNIFYGETLIERHRDR